MAIKLTQHTDRRSKLLAAIVGAVVGALVAIALNFSAEKATPLPRVVTQERMLSI
jgi:hypothetical protein